VLLILLRRLHIYLKYRNCRFSIKIINRYSDPAKRNDWSFRLVVLTDSGRWINRYFSSFIPDLSLGFFSNLWQPNSFRLRHSSKPLSWTETVRKSDSRLPREQPLGGGNTYGVCVELRPRKFRVNADICVYRVYYPAARVADWLLERLQALQNVSLSAVFRRLLICWSLWRKYCCSLDQTNLER
jgi:hypothetical protein